MIEKLLKANILKRYSQKEDRLFVANLLDKIEQSQNKNICMNTHFLNQNEIAIAISILHQLQVEFERFVPHPDCEKEIIFLLPTYDIDLDYAQYVGCLKIESKVKLTHQDYMGAIYALGMKRDMIGDIFVEGQAAYVFLLRSCLPYFQMNLFKVGRNEVYVQEMKLQDSQQVRLHFVSQEYRVASLRIDVILCEVFHLSRSTLKQEIMKENVFVNAKQCLEATMLVKENDIISFAKHGKIKMGKVVGRTKHGNYMIEIKKYS